MVGATTSGEDDEVGKVDVDFSCISGCFVHVDGFIFVSDLAAD